MTVTVVISQPRYLPALNYLARLVHSDRFVLLENVQRQARGYENRNRLLQGGRPRWFTLPIASSSRCLVREARPAGAAWVDRHVRRIEQAYGRSRFYDHEAVLAYYDGLASLAESGAGYTELIRRTLRNLIAYLGLEARWTGTDRLGLTGAASGPENLLEICRRAGADRYVSGPNGRRYGVEACFRGSGIEVAYHDFVFETYDQGTEEPFVPALGFFDALFNAGRGFVERQLSREKWLSELHGANA